MSVSRSNGSNAEKDRSRWDNLTKQTSRVRLSWDGTQASGASNLDNFHTIAPAGGVDRGKVMELVRARIHTDVFPGADVDNLVSWTIFELTTDPESSFTQIDDSTDIDDYDGITGLDKNIWQDDEDPGTVDVWRSSAFPAFEDETNGAGGAAYGERYYNEVNYRNEYGITGPIFDQHDTLNLHARAMVNSGFDGSYDVVMHFDWLEWKVEEDLNDRLQPC